MDTHASRGNDVDIEAALNAPFLEIVTTQRAIRRLLPDPVDDAIVLRLIELALKAPTGSNGQNWEFVVVKDADVKARLARRYEQVWSRAYGPIAKRAVAGNAPMERMLAAVEWQVEHFAEVPVMVVACLKGSGSYNMPRVASFLQPPLAQSSFYGSIYPAVQNLLLGARAVGLGAALVTLPLWSVTSARRILGLPLNVTPCCVVPMGWPRGKYGPTTRRPVGEVVHLDRFGNQPWKDATG